MYILKLTINSIKSKLYEFGLVVFFRSSILLNTLFTPNHNSFTDSSTSVHST